MGGPRAASRIKHRSNRRRGVGGARGLEGASEDEGSDDGDDEDDENGSGTAAVARPSNRATFSPVQRNAPVQVAALP